MGLVLEMGRPPGISTNTVANNETGVGLLIGVGCVCIEDGDGVEESMIIKQDDYDQH